MNEPPVFRSFWQAGFESACHININKQRIDLLAATQHDVQAEEDYARLADFGIRTVREGIRWPFVDRGACWDFSSFEPMFRAAQKHGIQVIWTLCHYGWPGDLDLFSSAFVDRFARYCAAVARFISERDGAVPFFSPINEISFLSWAINKGHIFPYTVGRGWEVKCQLVRAAIAGCDAIWEVNPDARFVHVDPLIHSVPPRGRPDLTEAAAGQDASQFHAWDMLAGRMNPELGGHPRYLDIVGLNFYHANEWEYPDQRLRWEDTPRDERWVPLHRLLAGVKQRYSRPLLIAETSHFGVGRAPWLREIGTEVLLARGAGVALEGVCLYPILDRPDWEDAHHWHNSGLWDLLPDESGRLRRVLHPEYASELRRVQRLLAPEAFAAVPMCNGIESAPSCRSLKDHSLSEDGR